MKPKTILYTSTQIESEPKRAQLTHHVTRILARVYRFDIRGNLPGGETLYVQTGHAGGYKLWTICDNGGEFNVERVNDLASMRSIPYVDRDGIVDAGTVAYQIAMVIRGQEIDWSARFPDLVDDFGLKE